MVKNRAYSVVALLVAVQLTSFAAISTKALAEPNSSGIASAWSSFLRWFQPRKPPFAGRPTRQDATCIISPILVNGETVVKIWNDRPSIVWRGKGTRKIEMTQQGNKKSILEQAINSENQAGQVQYTKGTLQPESVYTWRLLDIDLDPTQTRQFQPIAASQRNKITAELKALQSQLESKGASPEAIALRRAEFFIQKDLGSDAVQELFAVKNPSEELKKTIDKITDEICTPSR